MVDCLGWALNGILQVRSLWLRKFQCFGILLVQKRLCLRSWLQISQPVDSVVFVCLSLFWRRSKSNTSGGESAGKSLATHTKMGITGLLPFLKGIQRNVHISVLKGTKVGIDAYCWLHKGSYSCAMEIVMKTADIETL